MGRWHSWMVHRWSPILTNDFKVFALDKQTISRDCRWNFKILNDKLAFDLEWKPNYIKKSEEILICSRAFHPSELTPSDLFFRFFFVLPIPITPALHSIKLTLNQKVRESPTFLFLNFLTLLKTLDCHQKNDAFLRERQSWRALGNYLRN